MFHALRSLLNDVCHATLLSCSCAGFESNTLESYRINKWKLSETFWPAARNISWRALPSLSRTRQSASLVAMHEPRRSDRHLQMLLSRLDLKEDKEVVRTDDPDNKRIATYHLQQEWPRLLRDAILFELEFKYVYMCLTSSINFVTSYTVPDGQIC